MINLFLAFDDQDHTMGTFNRGCLEDFEAYFNKDHPIKPKYIKTRTLNVANIEISLSNVKSAFVFSAYSHGHDDRLVSGKFAYIEKDNVSLFNNSLFYTVSCSSANVLADQLIENGCLCYFGYKNQFNYWDGYKEFSQCANYGLFKIFEGDSTDRVYDLMIKKYNDCIDDLVEQEDGKGFLQAALLRHNRDGLVRKGKSISIKDFSR